MDTKNESTESGSQPKAVYEAPLLIASDLALTEKNPFTTEANSINSGPSS